MAQAVKRNCIHRAMPTTLPFYELDDLNRNEMLILPYYFSGTNCLNLRKKRKELLLFTVT